LRYVFSDVVEEDASSAFGIEVWKRPPIFILLTLNLGTA